MANPPINMKCKLCNSDSCLFDIVDFNKFCSQEDPYKFGVSGIQIPYYRCLDCQFIQSPMIDELESNDIEQLIYNEDYKLVDPDYLGKRAKIFAREFTTIYPPSDFSELRILDFGSGLGVFEQELLALGFNHVYSFDPFSNRSNLPTGKFDLITCFECIEHHPFPNLLIKELLGHLHVNGTIIFSTSIQPKNIDLIRSRWWYIGPRNGHISIFHENSLFTLGKIHGLKYLKSNFHFFSINSPMIGKLETNINNQIILGSPYSNSPEFHSNEFINGVNIKWTAKHYINWKNILLPEGLIRIRIPFAMKIKDEYLENVFIKIGSMCTKTCVINNEIVTDFKLSDAGIYNITLSIAPPIAPSSFKDSKDNRLLGIAIPII